MSKSKRSKKPGGTSRGKVPSSKSSSNTSNLKKQVDLVNAKTVKAIERMASDPDVTHEKFYEGIAIAHKAFRLMYIQLVITEEMKKLTKK